MKSNLPIDILFDNLISSGKTPGLQYIAIKNDAIIFQKNAGMAEFENDRPIVAKSSFNACSVTKTFTSLGILQLAQAGKINLSDGASNYLSDLPFTEKIRISQLLSHTSGLPNPIPLKWAHLQSEEKDFDSESFIHKVLYQHAKLKYKPGEKFSYSNLNYLVLGQIIEKVSGVAYRDYIHRQIISKLDLSGMPLSFTVGNETLYARGYQQRFTLLTGILGFFIDKKKFTIKSSNPHWIKFNKYYVSGRAYGGLIANAYSLVTFVKSLFKPNSVLLSDEWKKILLTRQKVGNGKEVNMTLGWFTGKLDGFDYYAHAGAGGGYYCEMRMYPERNLTTAIMFNRSGIRDERFLDHPDHLVISQ